MHEHHNSICTCRPVYIRTFHMYGNELLSRRSWTETTKTLRCVYCRMSRSALILRLTGIGRIVLLSVKNKGNRWLLKLKLRYWYILTSKRFEICRQLLSSLTLCLCETGVNTTFRVLDLDWLLTNVDAKYQYDFCGRYGYSFWPIWSFRVADVIVADMVCGRYGTDPI